MLHRVILSLALTLLLGISQQGALLHGISHLADLDSTTSQPQQDHQSPQHTSFCGHCLSFSHLANAVGSSFALPPIIIGSHQATSCSHIRYRARHASVYAARAPPLHLI